MKTYSALEASEILKVSKRAIQKRCRADSVRKKDNKYLITQEHIDLWKEKIIYKKSLNKSEATNEPSSRTKSEQLRTNSERSRTSNERSHDSTQKQTFNSFLTNQPFKESSKLKEENASLREEIQELKERPSQIDIKPNERIEVFTNDEFVEFEKTLKEYKNLKKKAEDLVQQKVIDDRLINEFTIKDIDQNYENRYLKKDNKKLTTDIEKKEVRIDKLESRLDKMDDRLAELQGVLKTMANDLFTHTAIEAKKTDWKKDNK